MAKAIRVKPPPTQIHDHLQTGVDANEPPMPGKITTDQAWEFAKALARGLSDQQNFDVRSEAHPSFWAYPSASDVNGRRFRTFFRPPTTRPAKLKRRPQVALPESELPARYRSETECPAQSRQLRSAPQNRWPRRALRAQDSAHAPPAASVQSRTVL